MERLSYGLQSDDEMLAGYRHPDYARALEEFGIPFELHRSRGWMLKRQIPGFGDYDAMSCYPLFTCQDWSQLAGDLEDLGNDLVSLSAVIDPFGDYDTAYLRRCFRDVVIPFKEHFLVNLSHSMKSIVSEHHRRYAHKTIKSIRVERAEKPSQIVDDWVKLYTNLIHRHNIRGIQAFSKESFIRQLCVPGIVVFRAVYAGISVGMLLWYVQGDVAYYHLGAFSDLGYELRASFGLFWSAIEYFADEKLRWLNLGAGAGAENDSTDGLTRFKRGWSTDTRTVYFCGRILNYVKYSKIAGAMGLQKSDYFPAYRAGEFE